METRVVEGIGVVSLAKILGVMGLVYGLLMLVSFGFIGGMMGVPSGPELVVVALGSALYGAIAGVITAIVYNAVAALIGGIELELS